MKTLLLLLPVLGVITGAPAIVKRSGVVKRADEEMIFGNQQNRARVKKSDPNMEGLPDLKGGIEQFETKNVAPVSDITDTDKNIDQSDSTENELPQEQVSNGSEDEKTELAANEADESKAEESNMKEQLPPEEAEAIKELEDAEISESQSENKDDNEADIENIKQEDNSQMSELSESTKDIQAASKEAGNWYENPYGAFQLYKAYQNLLNNYPDYSSNLKKYYGQLERRYRRSAHGKFLKRSHRAKRDLPYSNEAYSFYLPDSELPDNRLFDSDVNMNSYEIPTSAFDADGIREIVYEGEPGLFIPERREELNIVPEAKRDSYFYPFLEEPEDRFGAFIPQKRDYFDQYGRLVRLARALAMTPQGREDVYRGYDWERK